MIPDALLEMEGHKELSSELSHRIRDTILELCATGEADGILEGTGGGVVWTNYALGQVGSLTGHTYHAEFSLDGEDHYVRAAVKKSN